jgi:hypothetical protein
MMGGQQGGGGSKEKEKRRGLYGPIAPKIEDDWEDFQPRCPEAGPGCRPGFEPLPPATGPGSR